MNLILSKIFCKNRSLQNVPMYVEERLGEIERGIQQFAKVDRQGLSQSLFFKILAEATSDTYTFTQTSRD